MEYWRLLAFIGTIIFLASGFLPLISSTEGSASLIDCYQVFSGIAIAGAVIGFVYGLLIALILYPITVILGFLSILKPTLTLRAGITGLICWIGAYVTASTFSGAAGISVGYGIYLGVVGAIILLITFFFRPR